MFALDVMSRKPVYEQIMEQLERFVLLGVMQPGDRLPSVRNLSMELSINPNTIMKAYSEMDLRGLIVSVPGKGCFVSENARELLRQKEYEKLKEIQPLVLSMALAGVERGDVLACVEQAYEAAKQMGGNGTDD